ncbi:MAG: hypothetical protein AB7N76_08830 [Planctomycetota bacterium]
MSLSHKRAPLALVFFKRRWQTDVADLLERTAREGVLAFDDVDMDNDLLELLRVAGREVLGGIASEVLAARGPLPEAELAPLGPELAGPAAEAFLRLLAANLAFRLRSDELLAALVAFAGEAPPPRLAPACLGRLLARCRSLRDARALIAAGPLGEAERQAALEATAIRELDLRGARLHVQAGPEALERALERAMRPRARLGWTQGLSALDRRRLLAHKQRGGWFTLLEEGDAPPPELARDLAREGGVERAAWFRRSEGEEDELRVYEGTRLVLDREQLAARIGGPPEADDLVGALRALGVTDLDPDHPRGVPHLRWAEAAGLDFKKKGLRSYCFALS